MFEMDTKKSQLIFIGEGIQISMRQGKGIGEKIYPKIKSIF